MQDFIRRQNIERFKKTLEGDLDPKARQLFQDLLALEEAKPIRREDPAIGGPSENEALPLGKP
jgi:hypothetical protein